MIPLPPSAHLLQVTSACVAGAVIVLEMLWMVRNKDRWMWGALVVLWAAHIMLYYVTVFVLRPGPFSVEVTQNMTAWSAWLRLHGLSTFALLGVTRVMRAYPKEVKEIYEWMAALSKRLRKSLGL